MEKVVNLPVAICYKGHHYSGITVMSGVSVSLKPAGCGVQKTQLVFTVTETGAETKTQPIAFIENVSGGEFESSIACPSYLKIKAI